MIKYEINTRRKIMQKTAKALFIAAALAFAGSSYLAPASAAGMDPVKAIQDAKDAQKQAASVGGEWRDTGKMIKKAEELLKQGKNKEAAEMAEAAEVQGMLGYMQATSQHMGDLHIQ
jgi:hypothetical protein